VFGYRQYLGLIEVAEMVYFIYSLVCGPILFGFVVPFRVCCLGLQKSSIFLTLFVVVSGS
jgi:hypothetical protein